MTPSKEAIEAAIAKYLSLRHMATHHHMMTPALQAAYAVDFAALQQENEKWRQLAKCAGFNEKGLLAVGEELAKREQEIEDLRSTRQHIETQLTKDIIRLQQENERLKNINTSLADRSLSLERDVNLLKMENERLRQEASDAPDVQEVVIRKLDLVSKDLVRELAEALKEAGGQLQEHHNMSLHKARMWMFDSNGDCKVCKPSGILTKIDAALARAEEVLK